MNVLRVIRLDALRRGLSVASLFGLVLTAPVAHANNIRVSNVSLTRQDTLTKTANVTFNLAWENSWRSGENRDAAWVFVKFRAPGSNNWEHAILSTNSAAHKAASHSAISAVADGMGAFVYGVTNQAGNVNYIQTKLRWNYGLNGYDFAEGAVVDVSVHAIEMVYIPEGAFYLGSGGSEVGHFYQYTDGMQITNPYLVDSENEITVGASNGNLYYAASVNVGDGIGIISNLFPKGYAAFYCMKYELSQGQYVEFLKKLTSAHASVRYSYTTISRYTIYGVYPDLDVSAPDRACNCISWADGAAYMDWAGLRPMTELEYEKACRGTAQPVPNEYAWGSTNVVKMTNEYLIAGSGTETALPTNANCLYGNSLGGPTRVGVFATTNSTRQSSGAGYYGVMELNGNMRERAITVGNNAGRVFTGLHGDGQVSAAGNANVTNWPGTDAVGSGQRGGHWGDGGPWLASERSGAAVGVTDRIPGGWRSYDGWRGVRTAP